ncbi:MAG: acyl-CoA desaturase [Bdellovibrionales bacterium]|nr:acyl-CoA desaturase [Bdellovibrionales bacterium]
MSYGTRVARKNRFGLILIHAMAFFAITVVRPKAGDLILAALFFFIRMLGISAGYHRLFTHRSFQAKPGLAFILALMGNAAGIGPIKRWVAQHWLHHRFAETEFDPHSPSVRGFWYAHVGWLLDPKTFDRALSETMRVRFPEPIEWIDRHSNLLLFVQIPILLVLHGLGNAWMPSAFASFGAGAHYSFSVAIVIGLHATFAVNSVCHTWGYTRKDSMDDSRNHPLIALATLGEGWHANHHSFPHSARLGFDFLEIDLTYRMLTIFEKLGWASNLAQPPQQNAAHRRPQKGQVRTLRLVPKVPDQRNLPL